MAGYDCKLASQSMPDEEVIRDSGARILLTRDKLLARSAVNAYYVKARNPAEQFKETKEQFNLQPSFPDQSRCPECNTKLRETRIRPPGVPGKVKSTRFWACSKCGKVYWQGRHWKGILDVLGEKNEG